jgi:4-amino-4-deoxy-L-arabinose transferase-like glycosyltransferase
LPSIRRSADYTAAALIVFVVLFWRLGVPTFWDPDEAHYAETSREMVEAGDWWAAYYNEEPFFDKPVLFHQLQGAAMVAFGANEFGARLVPALAALALVGITVWFGATAASWQVGMTAGLLLAVNPALFALARYAILDTLFTAFMFGGAASLAIASLRDRPHLQWPGYVAIALAVLTKGPLALVLCGLTLIIASLASKDARRRLLGLHGSLAWRSYWRSQHPGFCTCCGASGRTSSTGTCSTKTSGCTAETGMRTSRGGPSTLKSWQSAWSRGPASSSDGSTMTSAQ